MIGAAITIDIIIAVVAEGIAIQIALLRSIQRECIIHIRHTVVVIIVVGGVTNAVKVGIGKFSTGIGVIVVVRILVRRPAVVVHIGFVLLGGIQREVILRIRCAIVVIVRVGVVANLVAVGVGGFRRIQREGIIAVEHTVIVVIRVSIVTDAIPVSVTKFIGIVGKRILFIGNAVAIDIGILDCGLQFHIGVFINLGVDAAVAGGGNFAHQNGAHVSNGATQRIIRHRQGGGILIQQLQGSGCTSASAVTFTVVEGLRCAVCLAIDFAIRKVVGHGGQYCGGFCATHRTGNLVHHGCQCLHSGTVCSHLLLFFRSVGGFIKNRWSSENVGGGIQAEADGRFHLRSRYWQRTQQFVDGGCAITQSGVDGIIAITVAPGFLVTDISQAAVIIFVTIIIGILDRQIRCHRGEQGCINRAISIEHFCGNDGAQSADDWRHALGQHLDRATGVVILTRGQVAGICVSSKFQQERCVSAVRFIDTLDFGTLVGGAGTDDGTAEPGLGHINGIGSDNSIGQRTIHTTAGQAG